MLGQHKLFFPGFTPNGGAGCAHHCICISQGEHSDDGCGSGNQRQVSSDQNLVLVILKAVTIEKAN